jgi:hypothetical protein
MWYALLGLGIAFGLTAAYILSPVWLGPLVSDEIADWLEPTAPASHDRTLEPERSRPPFARQQHRSVAEIEGRP